MVEKRKLLILGGTRFVGKKVLKLLQEKNNYKIFVASRKEIDVDNFIKIDRKNKKDLREIFSRNKFDTVVDFINFSASDTEKLLSVLEELEQKPHIISISSTYVYGKPDELLDDQIFSEEDFDPRNLDLDLEISSGGDYDYSKGKRSMEAYLVQNYSREKYTIIRFPIILGEDDYTRRAYFFRDLILDNQQINLSKRGKKANYIFSQEAAEAIVFFINSKNTGIYNVGLEDAKSEEEIMEVYSSFFNRKMAGFINSDSDKKVSPFSLKNDFRINTNKMERLYKFDKSFNEALMRELNLMK